LEAALSWILKPQSEIKRSSLKKQRTNEFDEIEALRVRTAFGAVILTLDLSSDSVCNQNSFEINERRTYA